MKCCTVYVLFINILIANVDPQKFRTKKFWDLLNNAILPLTSVCFESSCMRFSCVGRDSAKMERRERRRKESKIRSRRELFLFLLITDIPSFSLLPFLSIFLRYFHSFVRNNFHCAVHILCFSSMSRRTMLDGWLETRDAPFDATRHTCML